MRDRERHKRSHAAESDPPLPEPQGDGEGGGDDAEVAERGRDETSDGRDIAQDDVTQRINEQREKYLRLAAEYDNFRKRVSRERVESGSRAQAELISRLIDALDDLARFAHVDPVTTDSQTLHRGIELVEQKMMKTLGAVGLEVLNPVDQSFDPNQHEAVATEPALSREDDHTVARVLQPGYRFNGQLLRPARVIVKQWNG
jgi:molecular chaperone GrpE